MIKIKRKTNDEGNEGFAIQIMGSATDVALEWSEVTAQLICEYGKGFEDGGDAEEFFDEIYKMAKLKAAMKRADDAEDVMNVLDGLESVIKKMKGKLDED